MTTDVATLRTVTRVRSRSPRRLAWDRFRRDRMAMLGLAFIVVFVVVAILAPLLAPFDPVWVDIRAIAKPPSAEHLLGTDSAGRDVLSRVMWGARVSMVVGLGAVAIYLVIGTTLGAIAGYARGVPDAVIMRTTDMFLAFPTLILLMALVPVLGHSLLNIVVVLGLFGWPTVARLVRGEFLSLREREYITAARSIGVPARGIVLGHLLPNVASPLAVLASFGVAEAIVVEAGLSLLGLGVAAPTPSWGQMLTVSTDLATVTSKPWMWIPPAVALASTVLSINFIGDALRDALDPRGGLRRIR